jgi:hypothetical protein
MVGKGAFRALPEDLERVLDSHGLRPTFGALSDEAQHMYLTWLDERIDRRDQRIELLIRSLRRTQGG